MHSLNDGRCTQAFGNHRRVTSPVAGAPRHATNVTWVEQTTNRNRGITRPRNVVHRTWWYCTYGTRPWSGVVPPGPKSSGARPEDHTFWAPKFSSPRHGRRTLMPRSTP